MKICVCGGRDYSNYAVVCKVLDEAYQAFGPFILVQGEARGADSLAKNWAIESQVEYESFPADWDSYGKSAGFIRNRQMLETGFDMLIAFPGGNGTANMVRITEKAGIPVVKID
jgi:YspA, cpYpsA-related SLOG family